MKLSFYETNCGLATALPIQQCWMLKFVFWPEMFPGLLGQGPQTRFRSVEPPLLLLLSKEKKAGTALKVNG